MNLESDTDITPYNGLRVPAFASKFGRIKHLDELKWLSGLRSYLPPPHVLGSGTNSIWGKSYIKKTFLKMEIPGFEIIGENQKNIYIKIGAGEIWDRTVARTINMGLSGIEALSAIPGTVGAAPVQNIGAYGQEIKNCLISLEAFDLKTGNVCTISNRQCQFAYRDSIFKKQRNKGLIIVSITLKLSKLKPKIPEYRDVLMLIDKMGISAPDSQTIRNFVIKIRKAKLPDPKKIPNCGSFFKNPLISKKLALTLKGEFETMPQHESAGKIKIPAGWLIENAGLKGKKFDSISIYKNNALVLTAPEGKANIRSLLFAKNYVIKRIKKRFGILLEVEPDIIY